MPRERPASLTYAVYGMYVGAALSLLSPLLSLTHLDAVRTSMRQHLDAQPGAAGVDAGAMAHLTVVFVVTAAFVGAAVNIGLWIWMAIANGRGIAWARVVATVFGGLGILSATTGLVGSAFASTSVPGTLAVSVIDVLLAVVLLVLLWLPSSSRYYQAVTAVKNSRRFL